jgi:hypothetical protein
VERESVRSRRMIVGQHQSLESAINSAIEKLVRAEIGQFGAMVTLPVRYPSGASVVLQLSESGDRCLVTDYGMAYLEAEMIGTTRSFVAYAPKIAERTGIRYDGRSFFAVEVPKDRLAGAMTVVANCSHRAALYAASKASEEQDRGVKEQVYERLSTVFGRSNIDRDIQLHGSSSHAWPVSFSVSRGTGRAIVETVTAAPVSISSVVTKFHDIGRLEFPPPRLIVTRNKRSLGNYLGVLAPVSTALLEIRAANDDYIRYSEAV